MLNNTWQYSSHLIQAQGYRMLFPKALVKIASRMFSHEGQWEKVPGHQGFTTKRTSQYAEVTPVTPIVSPALCQEEDTVKLLTMATNSRFQHKGLYLLPPAPVHDKDMPWVPIYSGQGSPGFAIHIQAPSLTYLKSPSSKQVLFCFFFQSNDEFQNC